MAKLFLGSVGTAEAFEIIDGSPVVAFTSKTLTDSAVNISTTSDVVRGGTGAAGVFTFSHDATVDITLTDVLFKDAYLEAQLGQSFSALGVNAYKSEKHTATAEGITLDQTPEKLTLNCVADPMELIWIKAETDDEYQTINELELTLSGSTISGTKLVQGTVYCVRYLAHNNGASEMTITTNILPKEYLLIITCPLYAGDACSASSGKPAGSVTFEIPRFKLNGAQDLSMNMSSNTTLSLSGTALAMDAGCDVNGSDLLRIIKVVEGADLTTGLTDLVLEAESVTVADITAGYEPVIYAIYGTKTKKLDLADITLAFPESGNTGTYAIDDGELKGTSATAGDKIFIKLGDKQDTLTVVANS